ncbi:MAG: hypothetical protein PUC59_05070, partial [Firmicutes bacterium]|nr:hypothetical protein [Bacillota bacterium]
MRILDQRNFYSRRKLRLLGEWEDRTVLLEQTEGPEPFFQVLLLRGDSAERMPLRIPLQDSVLRRIELEGGSVRALLSRGNEIRVIRQSLSGSGAEQAAFSFCGTVADACFAGQNGCFVRTEADGDNAPLYRELERMTGRSAFLFYAEPQQEICVPVQDLRLLDVLPGELQSLAGQTVLYGIHRAPQTAEPAECEPPLLKSCVLWAGWEPLHTALLRGEDVLPLQFPLCAEPSAGVELLGTGSGRMFFVLHGDGVQSLYSLELSAGQAEKLAESSAQEGSFAFVRGLGCCRVEQNSGRLTLQPVNGEQMLVFPEKAGIPAAWMEERYLLSISEEGAIRYDVRTKTASVY